MDGAEKVIRPGKESGDKTCYSYQDMLEWDVLNVIVLLTEWVICPLFLFTWTGAPVLLRCLVNKGEIVAGFFEDKGRHTCLDSCRIPTRTLTRRLTRTFAGYLPEPLPGCLPRYMPGALPWYWPTTLTGNFPGSVPWTYENTSPAALIRNDPSSAGIG